MNWISWVLYSKRSRWISEPEVSTTSVEDKALTYMYFSGNHGVSILWILWAKHEIVFLGMAHHWWCNGQFLLWIKRFYIISHFSALYLTTRLLTLRLSTSGYVLYTFCPILTWLTRLLQKRPSWKTSTLLYIFVRTFLVCTVSAALDRLA